MNTETKNFENERRILDSGARREFASGAVRDIQEGKGRCDLLPLDTIEEYLCTIRGREDELGVILFKINNFLRGIGDKRDIHVAIDTFCQLKNWSTFDMILEVSKHYEEGAKKYAERNWEKGIPAHCYVDSGIRHLIKWCNGMNDEPHDRAFVWNMLCLLWTIDHKPELNDLPYAQEQNYVKNQDDFTPEERITLLKAIREASDRARRTIKGDTKDGK